MRHETCELLLRNALQLADMRMSRRKIHRLSNYLITHGIPDEVIQTLLVPLLVQAMIAGCDVFAEDAFKKMIMAYLQEKNISLEPMPERTIMNDHKQQRRMDSLARILSLSEDATACIAVAFVRGEFVVASNTLKKIDAASLSLAINNKIIILRKFLKCLSVGEHVTKDIADKPLKFSKKVQELAHFCAEEIGRCHGIGDILPAKRKATRSSQILHLQIALLKIAEYYFKGILTDGRYGFNEEQRRALLVNEVTLIIPDMTSTAWPLSKLHAEQAIVSYLMSIRPVVDKKTTIGSSKLSCQACQSVLEKHQERVSYRGGHGIFFPNVYDIDKRVPYVGVTTRVTDNAMCPDDSDSEPEFGL